MNNRQEEATSDLAHRVRIIDCHGHFGHFNQTNIRYTDVESMLQVMDRVGVEKICISSFLSIGPDYDAGNEMVAEVINRYSDRFIGYAVVNPNRAEAIERELDRCFDRMGMRAIKLHPALHYYPIDGPAYIKVFEYADQRKLPILSHEWSPEFLGNLCRDYPQINFIVAHTGFWDGRGKFPYAEVITQYDNVFIDLAYSNVFYDVLEQLVELVGAKKVLFGSDFPLHDLAYQLGRVIFAKISDEEKRLILGENMLRIVKD